MFCEVQFSVYIYYINVNIIIKLSGLFDHTGNCSYMWTNKVWFTIGLY